MMMIKLSRVNLKRIILYLNTFVVNLYLDRVRIVVTNIRHMRLIDDLLMWELLMLCREMVQGLQARIGLGTQSSIE